MIIIIQPILLLKNDIENLLGKERIINNTIGN